MKTKEILRHYPLSLALCVLIWVVCLIPIPETPLDNVTLIDKWVHIAMYLTLSMTIGHEYFHANSRLRALNGKALDAQDTWSIGGILLWAGILPALMGGLVEIVQATCTGGRRSGDWLDFAADAVGSAIAVVVCIVVSVWR